MIKILFVCDYNTCRSPMAQYIMEYLVDKYDLSDNYYINSAATQIGESGNQPCEEVKKKLYEVGIPCGTHLAVQMKRSDYEKYDYIIAMDTWTVRNIKRIAGGDPEQKIHKLMEYTSEKKDIGDPFYEGNYDEIYTSILNGFQSFLNHIIEADKSFLENKYSEFVVKAPIPAKNDTVFQNEKIKQNKSKDKFVELIKSHTFVDYVEACKLLLDSGLSLDIEQLVKDLLERISLLQETIKKFNNIYQPNISQFYDYYIPETLDLIVIYLEYVKLGKIEIVKKTEIEVVNAIKKLILSIDDKIDEIYKFVAIEVRAKARTLENMMSQDGYVDPNFKIK